jgi:hypothetical protein
MRGYVVRDDAGNRIGSVMPLRSSYRASRISGTEDDVRRVSQGFRTTEAAEAWIRKAVAR